MPCSPSQSTASAVRSGAVPGRQRLVDAALALIVENGGCRGVNLRQIAVLAGCAHTNAYNYFDSLEELFWAAALHAFAFNLTSLTEQLRAPAAAADPLRHFFAAQVAIVQQHPVLYHLCWLEPLAGPPPPAVLQCLDSLRQLWVRHLGQRLAQLRSRADPAWAGQLVHGYFHGELCKLIGRHAFLPPAADDGERIVANTLALVDLVATNQKPP